MFYATRVQTRDTRCPFGSAKLDTLSQTFLGVGKSDTVTEADQQDMLGTFRRRPAEAHGYAVVDVVNTLLICEQMQQRDKEIYEAFGFQGKCIVLGNCGRILLSHLLGTNGFMA